MLHGLSHAACELRQDSNQKWSSTTQLTTSAFQRYTCMLLSSFKHMKPRPESPSLGVDQALLLSSQQLLFGDSWKLVPPQIFFQRGRWAAEWKPGCVVHYVPAKSFFLPHERQGSCQAQMSFTPICMLNRYRWGKAGRSTFEMLSRLQ